MRSSRKIDIPHSAQPITRSILAKVELRTILRDLSEAKRGGYDTRDRGADQEPRSRSAPEVQRGLQGNLDGCIEPRREASAFGTTPVSTFTKLPRLARRQ